MKQFLLHLDETKELGRPFVIQDLDETHLFINADVLETLQESIDDLMDRLHFPVAAQIGSNWTLAAVVKPVQLLLFIFLRSYLMICTTQWWLLLCSDIHGFLY